MDTSSTSIVQSEDTSVDGLHLVRSINKYLRKALKKIEAIQRASDRLQENQLEEPLDNGEESDSLNTVDPATKNGTDDEKRLNCSPSIAEIFEKCEETQVELDKDVSMKSPNRDINNADTLNHCNKVGINEDNASSSGIETIELDDLEDGNNFDETSLQVKCTQSKFRWPESKAPLLTVKPHSVFYKAFVPNLPKSATVANLKEWLNAKEIHDLEDIFIFSKENFKTSIITFSNKHSRDRLLKMDEEMFQNVPIKIRIYVSSSTPEVDKLSNKNNSRLSAPKRRKKQ